MSFGKDIQAFNDKVTKAATNIFRGTALSLMGKIVKRTPVDTGRLRNNWFPSLNRPSTQVDGGKGSNAAVAFKAKLGDEIYFTNNLPYAQEIENGNSKQAPQGMVKVTVTEYQQVIKEAVRNNK